MLTIADGGGRGGPGTADVICKQLLREGVKKHGYFTVRLIVREMGVTAPSLTISKCENVNLFSPWNMIL